jgi:hypothetical protein
VTQPPHVAWIITWAASLASAARTGGEDWMPRLNQFMWGALVLASGAAGLFFLRFWRKTRDRLFAIFALAFWILGLHWLVLALTPGMDEVHVVLYTIRLLAFLLILFAIVDKNRTRTAPPAESGDSR